MLRLPGNFGVIQFFSLGEDGVKETAGVEGAPAVVELEDKTVIERFRGGDAGISAGISSVFHRSIVGVCGGCVCKVPVRGYGFVCQASGKLAGAGALPRLLS